MLGLDPLAVGLAIVACTLAATIQGTFGFGFAMLAVPFCAMIDPRFAPVPQALLATMLVFPMAWRERHHIEWAGVLWILLGRVPGTLLGLLLLKTASPRTLAFILAGCVLSAVLALATGGTIPRNRATEFIAGAVSSVGSVVSSIGGPPIALLYRGAKGPVLRASLAAVFAAGLILTLTARGVTGEISLLDLQIAALFAPAILIALWLSSRLAHRVDGPLLSRMVLVLAAIAAGVLILRAL
ncbi:MAG: putative membrane protein YfcA [Bradymonadia bacterium]|jgi:uncharacterized membrane protein YfcA